MQNEVVLDEEDAENCPQLSLINDSPQDDCRTSTLFWQLWLLTLLLSRAVSSLEEVCTVVMMVRSLLVLGWAPGPQQSGAKCSVCSSGAGLVPGLKI